MPLSLLSLATAGAEEVSRYEFSQPHMGTMFRLQLYAGSREKAEEAAAAALTRVSDLDSRLSDYQADSELSRLSRTAGSGEAIDVSDDLWNVLSAAHQFSEASSGAFDVTVGPYVRLWRRARRTGQLPSGERLKQARTSVGYSLVELVDAERRVRLKRPGMRLDLGGIAKGYAADEALEVLREHGIGRALVDAGGDLSVGEAPPGQRRWRIAIAPLREESAERGPASRDQEHAGARVLLLSNCGVATSGDAYQFVEFEGRRYSHIVDPRTGMGVVGSSSVTVVAPDGMTADALASAVSVLGPEQGMALIEKSPGAAALVAVLEDRELRQFQSQRMDAFLGP